MRRAPVRPEAVGLGASEKHRGTTPRHRHMERAFEGPAHPDGPRNYYSRILVFVFGQRTRRSCSMAFLRRCFVLNSKGTPYCPRKNGGEYYTV